MGCQPPGKLWQDQYAPFVSLSLEALPRRTPIATRQSVEGPACKKQRAFAVKSQGLSPIRISKTPRHPNTLKLHQPSEATQGVPPA